MLSFCSEACKDSFAESDRDLGTCDGCGVEVKGDHREFVSGNTRYIKIGTRPKWDGYCTACRADLDRDGAVGFGDVLAVLTAWGPCSECPEDLDDSGAVDFADLLIVLAAWGPCP